MLPPTYGSLSASIDGYEITYTVEFDENCIYTVNNIDADYITPDLFERLESALNKHLITPHEE